MSNKPDSKIEAVKMFFPSGRIEDSAAFVLALAVAILAMYFAHS